MTQDVWKELVTVALIGTERRPLHPPTSEGELGQVLARVDTAEPEGALLAAAATVALHRRAGMTLPRDGRALPAPSAVDEQPRCAAPAGGHLRTILENGGEYGPILREWLQALVRAVCRVPEEYIPMLLDVGAGRAQLHWLIIDAIGQRGRWLARQNPKWAYAAVSDDLADWPTGSGKARAWLLDRLRADDPAAARDLLLSNWANENHTDRAELLHALFTGLQPDDEPFLENVLDDVSDRVRERAVELLAHLPGSAFRQRMLARLAPHFRISKTGRRTYRLEISLIIPHHDTMARDGLKADAPKSAAPLNTPLYRFVTLLSYVEPAYLLDTFDLTAVELVAALHTGQWNPEIDRETETAAGQAKKTDEVTYAFRHALLGALAHAAMRHGDAAVADVLLEHGPAQTPLQGGLIQLLARSRREALVLHALKHTSAPLLGDHPALRHISNMTNCDEMWSTELTRAVLHELQETTKLVTDYDTASKLSNWLRTFAIHMDPDQVDLANRAVSTSDNKLYWWKREADQFLKIVRFRQNMLKELTR